MGKKITTTPRAITLKFHNMAKACYSKYYLNTFTPINSFTEEEIIEVLQDPYWELNKDSHYLDNNMKTLIYNLFYYKYDFFTSIFKKHTSGRLLDAIPGKERDEALVKKALESKILKIRSNAFKYCDISILSELYKTEKVKSAKKIIKGRFESIVLGDVENSNVEKNKIIYQMIMDNVQDFGYHSAAKAAVIIEDKAYLKSLLDKIRKLNQKTLISKPVLYWDIVHALENILIYLSPKEFLYNTDFIEKINYQPLTNLLEIKLSIEK